MIFKIDKWDKYIIIIKTQTVLLYILGLKHLSKNKIYQL